MSFPEHPLKSGQSGHVLIPQRATYRIRLEADKPSRDRVLRGQLLIEAETRSVLARFWRQAVGIWRREAGA